MMAENVWGLSHQKQYKGSRGNMEFKYLKKLQGTSIMFMLASLVLSHKIVTLFGVTFSAASIIFPNTILIANIVAVVYGYKHSADVMWDSLKFQIPFTVVCYIAINLPSGDSYNDAAYKVVFNEIWQVSLASLLGTYVGIKANIYVLSRFNFLLFYTGFWFRTLFACGIGELVFTIVAVPLMFFGKVSLDKLASIVMTSVLIKLTYSSLLSYVSEFFAKWVSKKENINYTTSSLDYNPFDLEAKAYPVRE